MYDKFTTEGEPPLEAAAQRKTADITVVQMPLWAKIILFVPFILPRLLDDGSAPPLEVRPMSPEAQVGDGHFVVE
jgi:hypothetical protein